MYRQIAYQKRSGAIPNPGSWSPLRSINLSSNLTDISQLSQGIMGWKETAVERRLRIKAELRQLKEDELIKEGCVFVPEMPPTPTMALMDVSVERYRASVSLNKFNPVSTAIMWLLIP
jgi:hypothetical protein